MANLAASWSDDLSRRFPRLACTVEHGRVEEIWPPTTGELLRAAGTSALALCGDRPLSESGLAAIAREDPGLRLLQVPVALDAIAVVVHPSNPAASLSLGDLEAIYDAAPRGGRGERVATWSQLGSDGVFGAHEVLPYARGVASAQGRHFGRTVLPGGRMASAVRELPGTRAILAEVATQPGAIGYAGVGYLEAQPAGADGVARPAPAVRVMPIAPQRGAASVEPTRARIIDGSYPLGRALWLRLPLIDGRPSPNQRPILRHVLSREGQQVVARDGYQRIPTVWAERALALAEP